MAEKMTPEDSKATRMAGGKRLAQARKGMGSDKA